METLVSSERIPESPMHVLHFAKLYYPVIGGCEISTRGLSKVLAKMGHNITIATTDAMEFHGFKTKRYLEKVPPNDKNVTVIRFHVNNFSPLRTLINFAHMSLEEARKVGLARTDSFLTLDALQTSTLINRQYLDSVRLSDYDVVNATQIGHGELFFLQKSCKKSKTPFVFTPRTHTQDPYTARAMPLCLKIANNAEALIAFTKHEKEYYARKGVDPKKIFVTGVGVGKEDFLPPPSNKFRNNYGIPEDYKVILNISRMEKYKGAKLIIESMKEVWKKKPNSILAFVGKSTSYTQEIREIAKKETRIIVLSDVNDEIKKEALFSATLLVNPSQIESFGRVLLEAWAAEKPVIAARTPVNECLIDEEKDGLLFNCSNSNELAHKIIFLLENESIAMEMGKNGKEKTLLNFSWERIAKLTLDVYKWAQNHRLP